VTRIDRSRLPDVGADPRFVLPAIVRHTLRNGLRVWTVEHHSVPVVTFILQVDGGSGADPEGREGLAAVVADMADEGTGALTAIDVSDALSRIGADYDVDVGGDGTDFTLTTLTRFAARGASLLADMIARPSLREGDFTRVRQLRLDRLRQLKDVASAVAEQTFLRLVYGTHPYAHMAIGSDASLRRVTPDDVVTFHGRSFRPSRATLIACGAMSHDGLLSIVENAFGGWLPPAAGDMAGALPASEVAPPEEPSTRLAVVQRPSAAQSELRIGQLATRRVTPDYPALVVMNAVVGGQFVSRINLKLREEKGYTYGARTGFDWRRGISPFALQTSVHTASTADAIADALAEITSVRGARPPSEEEMSLAKASLTRGYPRGFETAQQVARSVAVISLYGLPDTYFEKFVPLINAVTGADVVDVAVRHLDPSRLTTLVVGDYSAIADSLARLKLGEPQIRAAEF
jgi:predicted Zn-dependent peptidase